MTQADTQAVALRHADEGDRELLWVWANDPATRAASFDPRPIPWEEHAAWFRARQTDPRSRIYVVVEDAQPAGVVRFELGDPDAVVSINLAPTARGRGLGEVALRKACVLASQEDGVSSVIAYIKPDNQASQRAFARAGFVPSGSTLFAGAEALTMRWPAASGRT